MPDPAKVQSAVLEYACGQADVFALGLQELRRTLPYLYGTRRTLGHVELRTGDDEIESWEPSEVEQTMIDGGHMVRRKITVAGQHLPCRELHVYRFTPAQDAPAAALVLVEQTPSGFGVCLPDADAPRVFREYPLRSSGFLPVNFMLDGKFDPEQERRGLLMSANDKALLEQAFSAGVIAVHYAIEQKWKDAHWLARATCPSTGFDAGNIQETEWWTERLKEFAQQLAVTPIVECTTQFLPAIADEGACAQFIAPWLLEGSDAEETSVERLWPLVAAADQLLPPKGELASDWTTIAKGWRSLGVMIDLISVARLAEQVRADANDLDELEVTGDALEWLAAFIDIVGECWSTRAGVDMSALTRMIPNQNRRLCSPLDLKRDGGVSGQIKDICTDIGYDIRHQILVRGFEEIAHSLELRHLTDALVKAIPTVVEEEDVVAEAVERMRGMLPEDKRCDDVPLKVKQATVRILAHFWESQEKVAASVARQVPLVASSNRAMRWSSDRLFMAPVRVWPDSARPFEAAYPPDRVLDDFYAGSEAEEVPNVTIPLVEWGMAHADPVFESVFDLRDRRLAMLTSADDDTNGIVVRQERLSQIALLQPEVLNRCQEGVDEARALLGLVLCCVARRDPAWKEQRTVQGRRSREEVEVSIRGALWLADLKVRAWVPVPGEDDRPQKMLANANTLNGLLNSSWLQDNDDAIRLLSECFGFDQLELRLMGIAQDDDDRQELRNSLAELVETGGADPSFYTDLAEEVEARRQRKRDVERCRTLGLAVQEAIGAALRHRDLDVTLVDKGFDYEVALRNDDVLHDTGSAFELGPYLVEVKATTTGQARLTPMQAATATQARDRYVLCVVDLRHMSDADLELDWTDDRVEALAKLVPCIGEKVGETYDWVEMARTQEVSIRNESALRYEVPPQNWESGVSIAGWVKAIMNTLS